MKVVLVSTYEMGRQPFGLASPAAWLRARGHAVTLADLAVGSLPSLEVCEADLVGVYLPMHTATRLAVPVIERIRRLNPAVHICCYGLYAPLNAAFLKGLGVQSIIGGEFEQELADLARTLQAGEAKPARSTVNLDRLKFLPPDREGLPVLARYPKLVLEDGKRNVGYTEASRGCKHLCRHCPVVPVYQGSFRVVQADVVLEDIRRQVAAGAGHITFGDPDFLNGPSHALRIVETIHLEFPTLTYDITAKVEHLLAAGSLLPKFRETGCLFVTTAVESFEDRVLEKLEKGHTHGQFIELVHLFREHGLSMAPTFLPFTPWTSSEGYRQLLAGITELDLIDNVAPVQLTLRLLIPSGSRLLELADVQSVITGFDPASLSYRWQHPDPAVDQLASEALRIVDTGTRQKRSRRAIFRNLMRLTGQDYEPVDLMPRTTVPYLEEPWFC